MKKYLWLLTALLLTACNLSEAPAEENASAAIARQMIERQIQMPKPAKPQNLDKIKEQPSPKPERMAYITIDDGPSAQITPQILDILQEQEVKATFFVLPQNGLDHIYERMIAEGHQLGNHSYSHDYDKLYGDDIRLFREDVLKMRAYLEEGFNYETNLFRFPGGSKSWNPSAIKARRQILRELDYRDFDWDISTGDTDPSPAGKDPKVLAANVSRISDREKLVILMHDSPGKQATVEALPAIIENLKARGYAFDILGNYSR